MTNPERRIWFEIDKKTLNKIWRKHKVSFEEILEFKKGRHIINRVRNKYRIIGKTQDRFLTIFAYKIGSTYKKDIYKLATARNSTAWEKNYYRRET